MTENDRNLCKLLAFLLEYPGASWREEIAEIYEIADTIEAGDKRQIVEIFLAYVSATPPIVIQEAYTSAFDLAPETSLNLTYHLLGDNEDRGKILAGLLQIYRAAGYDATGRELPDFLPLVLEFLAICPELQDAALIWSSLGTVASLAGRLKENLHPYSGLMELAANILRPHIEEHSHTIIEEA